MARIMITGASSGFGAMTAEALASTGHQVFATMRDPKANDGVAARNVTELAAAGCAIEAIQLDVTNEASVMAAVEHALTASGSIDVVIHNAGHMAFGPAEAFTAEQFAAIYDVNVLGTQRLNRAILPSMRRRGGGLLIWVGSSSSRGGTPPFLTPYFAAKAAMDALAQSYALEIARFGIEATIIVPGAFTGGTNHFAHAGQPADVDRAQAWWQGPYHATDSLVLEGLARLEPQNADPQEVAREIARVVALPKGQRSFRSHIDPSRDGAEIVNAMADRVREQLLERIGLADLLKPAC